MEIENQNSPLLEAALAYHALGLCVIPIGEHGNGKQPALPEWKTYQKRLPNEAELRSWFSRSGVKGLAVVLGTVSGGVCCRDFDTEATYEAWAKRQPQLAATLPTVKTKRGYHVYFRSLTLIKIKKVCDGEIRGEGAYCLVPPSVHPSGTVYEWKIPIKKENLLVVKEAIEVFSMTQEGTESTESTEGIEEIEGIENTDEIEEKENTDEINEIDENRCGGVGECVLNDDKIAQIVQVALPTGTNANHHHLFILARAVKLEEQNQEKKCSEALLKKIFSVWYSKNQSNLDSSQTRYDYFLEFLDAYEHARYALGNGQFDEAWRRANKQAQPAIALKVYPEDEQMRLLVGFCRELQRCTNEKPFYLAFRGVQKLFKLPSPKVAGRRLKDLVKKKVIAPVEKYDAHHATRYKYLHPLNDDSIEPQSRPENLPQETQTKVGTLLERVEVVDSAVGLF